MNRWLYQDWFEPVSQDAELVTVDKWFQPLAEPVRRQADASLYIGSVEFVAEPSDLTPAETITVDKWYRPLAEPIVPGPDAQAGTFGFIVEPTLVETPVVGDWNRPLEEPVRTVPPMRGIPTEFFVAEPSDVITEAITLDKWYTPLSLPVLPLPMPVEGSFGFRVEPSLFIEPSFDSWFVMLGNPALPEDRIHASAAGAYMGDEDDFGNIVNGPYYVAAQEIYSAGAVATEVFVAGDAAREVSS